MPPCRHRQGRPAGVARRAAVSQLGAAEPPLGAGPAGPLPGASRRPRPHRLPRRAAARPHRRAHARARRRRRLAAAAAAAGAGRGWSSPLAAAAAIATAGAGGVAEAVPGWRRDTSPVSAAFPARWNGVWRAPVEDEASVRPPHPPPRPARVWLRVRVRARGGGCVCARVYLGVGVRVRVRVCARERARVCARTRAGPCVRGRVCVRAAAGCPRPAARVPPALAPPAPEGRVAGGPPDSRGVPAGFGVGGGLGGGGGYVCVWGGGGSP